MKRIITILGFFYLQAFNFSYASIHTRSLDDLLSIDFICNPVRTTLKGGNTFQCSEDYGTFQFSNITTGNPSIESMDDQKLEAYYLDFLDGFMKKGDITKESQSKFVLDKFYGCEISGFRNGANDENNEPDLIFVRVIYLNGTLYMISTIGYSESRSTFEKESKSFFNSLRLIKKPSRVRQVRMTGVEKLGFTMGTVLGKLMIAMAGLILIALLILIPIIIYRRVKRKQG